MPEPAAPSSPPNPQRLGTELEFLTELCGVVASSTELKPILDWIVHKTTGLLGADEGSIKLLDDQVKTTTPLTIVRWQTPGMESGSWPQAITSSVMGYLIHRGEALASPDLLHDERFPGLRGSTTRVRAVLAVPLRVQNRVTGMLAVTHHEPGRRWTHEEMQLLGIVASNSAGVLEQARLRAEAELKRRFEEENRRMERELERARVIQMGLVPAAPLQAGPWEISGRVVPARQVGGDSYDYYALDASRLAFAIADVSGKGVPAALLMASVQASLRAFCDGRRAPTEVMRLLNQSVARAGARDRFVTLFYGELDHAGDRLRYVNAGHNYPLLRRRDRTVEELQTGGLPLGLFDEATYEEGSVPFAAGDALLLYSDGVSEATDRCSGQFGEERLRDLWRDCALCRAEQVIARLLEELERFRADAAQSDDVTLMVVEARP